MPGDWPSVYADEASPAWPSHPIVLIHNGEMGTQLSYRERNTSKRSKRRRTNPENTIRKERAAKLELLHQTEKSAPSSASGWLYAFSSSSSALASLRSAVSKPSVNQP
jgi:hypothetical protein